MTPPTTPTPTPRTDAYYFGDRYKKPVYEEAPDLDFARQLERELAQLLAENERLKNRSAEFEDGCTMAIGLIAGLVDVPERCMTYRHLKSITSKVANPKKV